MKSYNNSNSIGEVLKPLPVRLGLVALALGAGLALSMPANATPPPANSVIGNQAVAEYKDVSGAKQTTLSNLVETTVTEVGAFTLAPDVTKNILAGQTATAAHILTNNGNAADTFTLDLYNRATNGGFTPASFKVYVDNNADGIPDDLNAPLCTATAVSTTDTKLVTSPATCTTPSVAGVGSTLNLVVAVQSTSGDSGTPWEKYELVATPVNAVAYGYPTATVTINGVAVANTAAQLVTDNINITTGPIFDLTKSINVPGGAHSSADCTVANYLTAACTSPKTATYTLTYTNKGNAPGTVQLQDLIGTTGSATEGMAYIPGSAKWTDGTVLADNIIAPATADASNSDGASIYYETIAAAPQMKLNAFVTGVKANVTGSISFKVLILSTAKVGTSTTTNTAKFEETTGTPPSTNPGTPTDNSNPSPYIVGLGQVYDVVANNDATVSTDASPDTLKTGFNLVDGGKIDNAGAVVTSVAAGQAIFFDNVIWNTGDGTDTFDVKIRSDLFNTFPVGTSFQLFKTDGINPLLDTTGNGTPDTGPIPAGQGVGSSYIVKVKAIIPLSACDSAGVCAAGGVVQIVATSVGDQTQSNNVFDKLTTITAGSVDLRNLAAAAGTSGGVTTTVDAGVGAGTTPGTGVIDPTIVTAKTGVSPGSTQYFDLPVYNMSAVADSYALTYHVKVSPQLVNVSGFVEGTLPAGWKVTFRKNTAAPGTVCSSANVGAEITSTDLINTGSSQHVCAVVTTPASATVLHYLHFKAQSLASGARDVKIDSIDFTAVGTLSLTPDNTGQVYPGGTVVYPHVLAATGTSNCASVDLGAKMDAALLNLGWSAKVYLDVNGDGVLNTGTDTFLGAADSAGTAFPVINPLVPGTAQHLLVQVFAPNGAAIGVTDLVALKSTGTCGGVASTANATDLTTVIIGQLRLYKKQSIDVGCDGADNAYSVANISAKPGQCIEYQVTAINEGAADVKGVAIKDTTPVFTTSEITPPGSCTGGSNPAIVQPSSTPFTGDVSCTWGAAELLNPGNQVIMIFRVKIDN